MLIISINYNKKILIIKKLLLKGCFNLLKIFKYKKKRKSASDIICLFELDFTFQAKEENKRSLKTNRK